MPPRAAGAPGPAPHSGPGDRTIRHSRTSSRHDLAFTACRSARHGPRAGRSAAAATGDTRAGLHVRRRPDAGQPEARPGRRARDPDELHPPGPGRGAARASVRAQVSRPDGLSGCGPEIGLDAIEAGALKREDGAWRVQTCGYLDPDATFGALLGRPHATATGAPVAWLAGSFGGARAAALNASGEVVAWADPGHRGGARESPRSRRRAAGRGCAGVGGQQTAIRCRRSAGGRADPPAPQLIPPILPAGDLTYCQETGAVRPGRPWASSRGAPCRPRVICSEQR